MINDRSERFLGIQPRGGIIIVSFFGHDLAFKTELTCNWQVECDGMNGLEECESYEKNPPFVKKKIHEKKTSEKNKV